MTEIIKKIPILSVILLGEKGVKMINKNCLRELLTDRKTFWADNDCLDGIYIYEEQYKKSVMLALGNDEEAVKAFLLECEVDDLIYMSEFFEDIYGKFMNDSMWDFLNKLEIKIGLHD